MNICKEQLRFIFGEWINCQQCVKIQLPTTPWTKQQGWSSFEHEIPMCMQTRHLETCRSQQIWKHQRVKKVRPPNTIQTNALELRSRDESNTLVTKPYRVNRTRPFRVFESQTRSYCKVSTSLSHPISYRTTKTNDDRTNRIIKAYKPTNGDADNTKHNQWAKHTTGNRAATKFHNQSHKPKTATANMNHRYYDTWLRSGSKIHVHQDATDLQTTKSYESPGKAATRTRQLGRKIQAKTGTNDGANRTEKVMWRFEISSHQHGENLHRAGRVWIWRRKWVAVSWWFDVSQERE